MLRLRKAHPLPRAAGVEAAINPVSPADMAPTDVLAGADPDHLGLGGIESDLADRVRGLVFENGCPAVPALVVFQTPPEPVATYQTPEAVGWTATSAMRLLIRPGPMLRKGNAAATLASRDSGA